MIYRHQLLAQVQKLSRQSPVVAFLGSRPMRCKSNSGAAIRQQKKHEFFDLEIPRMIGPRLENPLTLLSNLQKEKQLNHH